ncbi:MAG: hypothetical protein QM770_01225 [Tepidisphaeraceae bacterium]
MLMTLACPVPALAQLRIVSLNAANSGSSTSGPRAGMDTILQAIGSTVSDDPTLPGSTGIAKPISVLCLQESRGSATTATSYAALLNSLYSTNRYRAGTLDGASTGTGTQSIVYDSGQVSLISETVVGTATTAGQPRQTLRYQLRPVGYGATADVYLYNGHWKASSDSTSANRRNIESTAIRANADALPIGSNIVYLGDLNVYKSSEAMYQTLLAAGNGQAFDPISKPGAWTSNASFKAIHTQSPFDPVLSATTGFNGTSGGMDDRFDQQLVSGGMLDGHGVSYIANSYQAFGNNGTHTMNGSIRTGTGASAGVLTVEAGILDHLPVVADYQLPAMMSVAVGSVPARSLVNSTVVVPVTVTNSAPVTSSIGADMLSFTLSGQGNLAGGGTRTAAAGTGGAQYSLTLNTGAIGISSGTVHATSSSEAVANPTFDQIVSTTVIARARPSLAPDADVTTATLDFGVFAKGSTFSGATLPATLYNRAMGSTALAAELDVDAATLSSAAGPAALINVSSSTTSVEPGSSTQLTISLSALDTASIGAVQRVVALKTSDEDLPGESNYTTTLVVTARIAVGGDANLDGVVNFSDLLALAAHYDRDAGTWSAGDFDRSGTVNFDDLVTLAANYTTSSSGSFAADWNLALSSVPEPSFAAVATASCAMLQRRRRWGRC